MAKIRVGLATVDFTPEPGLPLMGNFRDDYAARGVHDPLLAKAMVFEDREGVKAAVLAVDVCMLDRENVARMRRVVQSGCDVPPENVLIHATHTHSAPAPSDRFLFGLDFEPYRSDVEAFLTKAATAVALANENLAPADLSIGYAKEDRISFNRRLRRKDGSTQMNWEALMPGFDSEEIAGAWGPIDPEVACLVVEREGRPAAAIVSFGLHPAILAGDNWLYSADYPGYLAEALSRTLGEGFVCLFLNGCSGNVNHVDYRQPGQGRGFQMAERVGYMLGAVAHQAVSARSPVAADRVGVLSEAVSLERIQISDGDRRRCEEVLEAAAKNPPKGQVDGLPDAFYAELRLEMCRRQHAPDEVEVMVVRLGNVALVGLPGENFCESGLEIKRRSPARHTLVAGLASDAIGYLPTRESFPQGGYETTVGSTLYQEGAAERLVDAAVSQ
ncbi:MAG: neutral/alkaline non-lysosomal ceramidase N-terminal domain-containing protein, partial [Planctomycetota bacterium]